MALKIRKLAMPASQYSIKCPYGMTPTRIVIHNTAGDNPAENEIKYMQSNSNQVSFHYAVDDKEAVQGVDLWRNAWHAGDGANGKGNREGIAIEICCSKSGGPRFEKSEQNAAELTAKLLIDYGWGIDKVTKHQDYSGKYCPHRTLDLGWDRFLKMVEAKRKEMAGLGINDAPEQIWLGGYSIERAKNFAVQYWDTSKKKGTAQSYINGGFFGYYKSGSTNFTLPVGNLVADVKSGTVLKAAAEKYWKPYIANGKFRQGTAQNASSQFRGKAVTTLVVPLSGSPYIREMAAPPASAKYAVSGIPVIRDGVDVSYARFVVPQGWDTSCLYGTSRNFIGIRKGEIYIVTGTTKTSNFIASSEVYGDLKSFGFDDLLSLDGGGSYYHKYKGKANTVWSDREVNNIITY